MASSWVCEGNTTDIVRKKCLVNNTEVIRVTEVICHFNWLMENEMYCPTESGQNLQMYVMPSGLGMRGSSHFLQCVFFLVGFFSLLGFFSFGSFSQRGPPSIPVGSV